MIPPEHPKDLFKRQGAEKGRTVEHGAFQPDRTPRKEVGSLEFVTTLVEIPFHCFSVQINPEKPDVPLNKNDAFQKVQKRRVQEKR